MSESDTRLKRLPDQITMSQLYEQVVEKSNNIIVVIDNEYIIHAINNAAFLFLKMLDPLLERENVIGANYDTYINDLFKGHDEDKNLLIETLSTGNELSHHEKMMTLTDKVFYFSVDTKLLYGEDGQVIGAIGIYRDITRHKENETKIRNMEKLSALGQLAAGLAHEIRNPLTAADGFIQLLLRNGKKYLGRKEKKFLEITHNELKRTNQLVNEFLVLSKPESSVKKRLPICKLLLDIIGFMQGEATLCDVNIHYRCDDKSLHIYLDPEQMKQVFINLIKNALEAMPDGGNLYIHCEHSDTGVRIHIKDEGVGIPQEIVNRIFEPFFTTKSNGTGLGLSGAYNIITKHEGNISICSKPGEGTTITVTLPIDDSHS